MSQEVGGYAEARRLPSEVRRWWIDEMQREQTGREDKPASLMKK